MTAALRFSGPALEEFAKAKILGVRAGTDHRYTGVWVVVVEGRVFVRSWNDKPTGWYRAFQAQPLGSIQLAGREIAIRARRLRDERLRDAVTRAYAGKYDMKASEKWVRGFAAPRRHHVGAIARAAVAGARSVKLVLRHSSGFAWHALSTDAKGVRARGARHALALGAGLLTGPETRAEREEMWPCLT